MFYLRSVGLWLICVFGFCVGAVGTADSAPWPAAGFGRISVDNSTTNSVYVDGRLWVAGADGWHLVLPGEYIFSSGLSSLSVAVVDGASLGVWAGPSGLVLVEDGSVLSGWFLWGFGFVFVFGLIGIGVHWTSGVIGGGFNE